MTEVPSQCRTGLSSQAQFWKLTQITAAVLKLHQLSPLIDELSTYCHGNTDKVLKISPAGQMSLDVDVSTCYLSWNWSPWVWRLRMWSVSRNHCNHLCVSLPGSEAPPPPAVAPALWTSPAPLHPTHALQGARRYTRKHKPFPFQYVFDSISSNKTRFEIHLLNLDWIVCTENEMRSRRSLNI